MRNLLCVFLTVVICVIPGCYLPFDESSTGSGKQSGEKTSGIATELQGPHYAKLNSIGCLLYNDMEMAQSANRKSDYDTIDNLIREKRCFVIPTDTDIFINERVKGDIVSAKIKDSREAFYTVRSNLVAK